MRRLEIIVLVLIALFIIGAVHLYVTFYTPLSRDGIARTITIPRGTSFRVVAEDLERSGVVRDSESLILAASVLGAYKKVKAGEYEFSSSMTPVEILEALVKGRVKRHLLTIPEGYNIREIAAALGDEGVIDASVFISRATDRRFAASIGIEGATFEGYLFPDTYELTKGMTADEIIRKMSARFKEVYSEEFEKAARARGMSMARVITLASIIEKETGAADERPLISAVFHNRLKKGMKLQSDPTVVYGIKDFNGNITRKDLLARTPYNTYANFGLPPGPIANPGRDSIRAAIDPAPNGYLYFVSRNDGTHVFSMNLIDHNKAVYRFQKTGRPVALSGKNG